VIFKPIPTATAPVPIWVKERRQPRREELRNQHLACGGQITGTAPTTPKEHDPFWDTPAVPAPVKIRKHKS